MNFTVGPTTLGLKEAESITCMENILPSLRLNGKLFPKSASFSVDGNWAAYFYSAKELVYGEK